MIDIRTVLILNCASIVVLLLLLLQNYKSLDLTVKSSEWYFFLMVIVTLVQSVLYSVTYYCESKSFFYNYYFATISNGSLYIVNTALELLFVLYLHSRLKFEFPVKMKYLILLSIPAMFIVVGVIVNIFTPVFFIIDKVEMTNERTSLDIIARIIPALYFSYAFTMTYIITRKKNYYLVFPVILFLLPIVLAIITDSLIYGISVLPLAFSLSLVFLYMSSLRQSSAIDSLSGLYSRNELFSILSSVAKRKKGKNNELVVGILLDIDHFKRINDNYGHLVGDDAIRKMGYFLRSVPIGKSTVYRYAGDEFVILATVNSFDEVSDGLAKIRTKLNDFNEECTTLYKLSFSNGCAIFDFGVDSMDSFIKRMDVEMYKNKNLRYESSSS